MGCHICCQQYTQTDQQETEQIQQPNQVCCIPIQPDKYQNVCKVTEQLDQFDRLSEQVENISCRDDVQKSCNISKQMEQELCQVSRTNLICLCATSLMSANSPKPLDINSELDAFDDFHLNSDIEESDQLIQQEASVVQVVSFDVIQNIQELEQIDKRKDLMKTEKGHITLNNIESRVLSSPSSKYQNLQSLYEIDLLDLNVLSPKSGFDFQKSTENIRQRNYSFDPTAHEKAVKQSLLKYQKHKNVIKKDQNRKSRFPQSTNGCLF